MNAAWCVNPERVFDLSLVAFGVLWAALCLHALVDGDYVRTAIFGLMAAAAAVAFLVTHS